MRSGRGRYFVLQSDEREISGRENKRGGDAVFRVERRVRLSAALPFGNTCFSGGVGTIMGGISLFFLLLSADACERRL